MSATLIFSLRRTQAQQLRRERLLLVARKIKLLAEEASDLQEEGLGILLSDAEEFARSIAAVVGTN